jgi:hypothetical protein
VKAFLVHWGGRWQVGWRGVRPFIVFFVHVRERHRHKAPLSPHLHTHRPSRNPYPHGC